MIKIENVNYIYEQGMPFERQALFDINLEIPDGDFVALIGHTGSGKSTLVQHMNALERPTSGQILVDGVDVTDPKTDLRLIRRTVGLVFQYPEHQLFEETVYKDIAFGPLNMGLSAEEADQCVKRAARLVGLKEKHMEKSPFELSGGQKRRVAIAGVLAMSPRVLILDEPTAGLDPKGRDRILGQIQEYHQESGATVLIVSHSMEDVARFAQKVLVMNRSRLFMYDDTEAVFAHAAEIAQMGLAVPQVTNIFTRLAALGYDVNPNIYTVEDGKQELLRLLRAGQVQNIPQKGGAPRA